MNGAPELYAIVKQWEKELKRMSIWKLIPHRHIYRLGDYSGKRCRRCGRFRKLEQKDK